MSSLEPVRLNQSKLVCRSGTSPRKAGGRPKVVFNQDEVLTLRAQGLSLRQIAARMHIGLGTVCRTLRAVRDPATAFQNPVEGAVGRPQAQRGDCSAEAVTGGRPVR